ncbi:hypothetical protein F2Q69_00012172 [Brassica cretica]|uniref:Uncharacterized protein n=1 Tax=Brassica cretica TaxID=69181 RepID=A0A8S9QRV6_BRACR|nr:hypothetical protein F2Q69_00012172 [Brassica cretica]
MTKRPLSRNESEQTEGAQRPPVVAPGGRSRLRERPGGVAARRRSLRATSLCHSGHVAPGRSSQATSLCRSGHVAPGDGDASDIGVSLCPSRSERVSQRLHGVAPVRSLPCTARPMITFIISFELQMHPNVSKNSMWYSNT